MNEARTLGLPIIHVRSTLRKGGADEKLFPSAWRMVFPVTVGEIPNIAEHAIEGTRWNKMSIDVHDEDYMVTTKKRLSAFYPTDLELLLRNLGIRRVVLTGCMTDCCVINTAFDAANRDFRVVVPRDLTRGSEHLEEPALRMISRPRGDGHGQSGSVDRCPSCMSIVMTAVSRRLRKTCCNCSGTSFSMLSKYAFI